jgi:crotonobetainyl-CoA:carnitine CoA-transferase CaiB-like acyl-CoA transferase
MAGPLEGVRVVELGVWVAGPAAGGILADWGADVVKIEPPTGDPARTFGRMLGLEDGASPPFEMDNRGKRSVVLDLTTEEDQGHAAQPASGVRADHRLRGRRA